MRTDLRNCLVTGQYPPQIGGVGHSAYRVANLLAGHGLVSHVVALQKWPVPVPFDESFSSTQEEKLLVHRVKVFYPDPSANGEPETLTRYNRELFDALAHFQRRFRYDVLHAFFLYPAGYIAGLVGQLSGAKVIASIRGNDVGKYAFDALRAGFVCSALANATYVTSVATSLLELANRALVPVAQKSRTILNSIDAKALCPRRRPPLETHGLVVGTVGVFRYKKGLIYLLKALSSLRDRFPFTFLLVGDFMHEGERESFLREVSTYGLTDHITITGKVPSDQVADHLQLFDILVFPSLFSEGCPLSMLEAMAMEKPVIASAVGAIPEVLRDGENGLLVEPGSSDDIARALVRLMSDSALRAEIARNGASTVGEMTHQRELQEWIEVYERVCG